MSGSKRAALVTAFKKAFKVKEFSNDWPKWKSKLETDFAELRKWVALCVEVDPTQRQQATQDLQQASQAVNQALAQFKTNEAQGGLQIRDTTIPLVLNHIETYRALAKQSPAKAKVNGQDVDVYWTDLPGFLDLPKNQRQAVLQAAAQKTADGLALYNRITNPQPNDPPLGQATPKDVTNLLWALKTKAQAKGGPYVKGAVTVPNGPALRSYLDTCTEEVYSRDSSHMLEQQGKGKDQKKDEMPGPGQTPRGMDFYGGGGDDKLGGTPPDLDRLLPAGMNALLYQQIKTPGGDDALYLKMETEGAYLSGRSNKKLDPTLANMQTRSIRASDVGNTIKHGMNLVKSKLGAAQHEDDDDLGSTREKTPEAIKDACKAIVKAVKDKDAKKILTASFGTELKWVGLKKYRYPRINTFMNALDKCAQENKLEFEVFPLVRQLITHLNNEFTGITPDEQDRRMGGEVVLLDGDI